MTNITCMIIIEDDERKSVTKRAFKHEESEGLANLGWCLGVEIGSAICAIKDDVAGQTDIKEAINSVLEEDEAEHPISLKPKENKCQAKL